MYNRYGRLVRIRYIYYDICTPNQRMWEHRCVSDYYEITP